MKNESQRRATELLQQLGLKEYEAKVFVALTHLPEGSAKDVSAVVDVPRTRVYDAVRVLEAEGLVQIHHTSPKQFRALSVEEAAETLERRYDSRLADLRDALFEVEAAANPTGQPTQEVWSLTGNETIAVRAGRLIEDAEEEVIFVTGTDGPVNDRLYAALEAATKRGVTVNIGSAVAREEIAERVPGAELFEESFDWMADEGDQMRIGLALLTDRDTLLVSTVDGNGREPTEAAVFNSGFGNALVVLTRRLLAAGLLDTDD